MASKLRVNWWVYSLIITRTAFPSLRTTPGERPAVTRLLLTVRTPGPPAGAKTHTSGLGKRGPVVPSLSGVIRTPPAPAFACGVTLGGPRRGTVPPVTRRQPQSPGSIPETRRVRQRRPPRLGAAGPGRRLFPSRKRARERRGPECRSAQGRHRGALCGSGCLLIRQTQTVTGNERTTPACAEGREGGVWEREACGRSPSGP